MKVLGYNLKSKIQNKFLIIYQCNFMPFIIPIKPSKTTLVIIFLAVISIIVLSSFLYFNYDKPNYKASNYQTNLLDISPKKSPFELPAKPEIQILYPNPYQLLHTILTHPKTQILIQIN